MINDDELSATSWALSIGVLGLNAIVFWRWAGTALPLAADISIKSVGEPPETENTSNSGQCVGRIASDIMYHRRARDCC